MKGEVAIEALREINGLLKTAEVSNGVLQDARVDHTTNMNKFHVSLIFSEECFKKIIDFNNSTNSELIEHGAFFYGRVKGNTIYVTKCFSEFAHTEGQFFDAAVQITDANWREKKFLTENSAMNDRPYNIVVHFHTHPAYGIRSNYEVVKTNTTRYSDQDLYTIGYLQKYHQPTTNNFVIFLGGLLAVDDRRSQISVIYYDPVRKDFFNISNLYYEYEGKVFQFNNYDITQSKKVSDTNAVKLMKTFEELK